MLDEARLRALADECGLTGNLDLAREVRALLHAMAETKADPALLQQAGDRVRAVLDLLQAAPRQPGHIRSVEGKLTGLGALSELGPFTGQLHPIAPPLRLTLAKDRAEAFATYGPAHQGAPGIVHGGIIAGTFDELLGVVQRGAVRMTVDLHITYRGPAPLGRALRYTTWLDRVEDRKAFVRGTLHDGDRLCTEASAIFVALKTNVFATPA